MPSSSPAGLLHAVELARRVNDRVVSYVRFQMTQLLGLVILFLVATIFNVNETVPLRPSMIL